MKDPLFFDLFNIFTGNCTAPLRVLRNTETDTTKVIARICKRMSFRQRVTATASVFLRRFYLKNSYCETDPFIVIAACCYVAAKAEESPVHIKTVVNESRSVFSRMCSMLLSYQNLEAKRPWLSRVRRQELPLG